jgi:hypothetical protein
MSSLWRGAWLVAVTALVGGCLYDADDRCGPHMRVTEIGSCVCEDGYVLSGTTCISCPEHEHLQGAGCVCDDGYARPGDGEACAVLPESGPGAPCSDAQPCTDQTYSFCARASNDDRYCTSRNCRTSADCPETFACREQAGGNYCQRTPLGQGTTCGSDADCRSYEATFCEPLISHSCLVQGCALGGNDCFEGWECCDVSSYGMPVPICIPEGNCP